MKEKGRSVVLLFFISLVLIPSFIYGASAGQKDTMKQYTPKVLCKITAMPQEIHIPKGSDEQEFRDMVEVNAYYKGEKKPMVVTDYTTNYNEQKKEDKKCVVTIQYTEGRCTKKACVKVVFCKQTCSDENNAPMPTTSPNMPGDEDINFPYIKGYNDDTFRPNQVVTREELATMLARLITKNRIPKENNQYDDLQEGRFSADAINYITQLGVMKPVTAHTFEPNTPVSLKEFKEIVDRLTPYIKNLDISLPSGSGNLTRAQVVVVLNQLFHVKCNTDLTVSPFKDVPVGVPEYDDILCATQPRE